MSKTYSAGIVTAYGAAKRAGYQGTYEDFCRQQAGYAESAATVEQAKTTAVNAASTATAKAMEATTAATAAQTAKTQTEQVASQALTDISTARSGAISAVQTEGQSQTANATAQAQAAATSATTASTKASEASASATSAGLSATNAAASATSAAQSASDAQDVLDSIPADYSDLSEDVDQLKADLGDVEDKTLNAFAVESASGAIVSFTDGANDIPLKSLVIDINPVQAGTGDPSPDNVRPITGWTGANVARTGKNLFSDNWSDYTAGTAYTYLNDVFKDGIGARFTFFDKDTSVDISGINIGFCDHYEGSGNLDPYRWAIINGVIQSNTTNVAIGSNQELLNSIVIYPKTKAAFDALFARFYIMVELGSTPTDYEPYAGQPYPISWQTEAGTVYGGTLDVLSGVLTVDRACVVFDGSVDESWVSYTYAGADLTFYIELQDKKIIEDNAICNRFKNSHRCWYTATNGVLGLFSEHNALPRLYFKQPDESVTDVAKWKTWLSENETYVVYKLTTPLTYQLTPQEVSSLLGINNIWADSGDAEVEYRADTVLYADKRTREQSGMIAPVETSYTATRNYTAGSLLIVDNTLYRVTANIANGGTITVGTNVVATTLSEVIASLS